MRILGKNISKNGPGYLKVECEEPEDFWHIYNLLTIGDTVTAVTFRKTQKVSSTGSTSSQKVRIKLTLRVDTIDFDTQQCTIRVKGTNIRENQHVSLGQSHTTELALHRPFSIEKQRWDAIDIQRIKTAADPTKSADLCVIVMEKGLAHVVLITSSLTITRARIEKNIPRKREGSSSRHDKAVLSFHRQILEAMHRHIDFDIVKCVVLASPAHIKDDFAEYMWAEAQKNEDYRPFLLNRSMFVLGHCSSGHKHSVTEVLSDPEMKVRLADTSAAKEVATLDTFFKLLNEDESRAVYGFTHVSKASEASAIDVLMVTESLFRSADIPTRRKYVRLVENVKRTGAEVFIFSSMHVSGERLNQLTGVAAILRFPMPELLDLEMSEQESSSDED